MCEHYCVNIHQWIASLNALYPVCACTMQVYLHLHVIYCHLHITMCHHVWTWCEHYCVNMYVWIVSLNALYPVCACTMQVYLHLHLLHCHLHITMSPYVNIVWTLLCEHASVNCFFKCIVPCMCIYNWCLSTFSFTTLPLAYVNIVWTLLCEHPSVNIFLNTLYPVCACTCTALSLGY